MKQATILTLIILAAGCTLDTEPDVFVDCGTFADFDACVVSSSSVGQPFISGRDFAKMNAAAAAVWAPTEVDDFLADGVLVIGADAELGLELFPDVGFVHASDAESRDRLMYSYAHESAHAVALEVYGNADRDHQRAYVWETIVPVTEAIYQDPGF